MKLKCFILAAAAAAAAVIQVHAETPLTRDFTFGLSDEFKAVKAVSEDDDGHDTFERFCQVRSELPDEIPVFEPYEAKAKNEIYIAPDGSDSNPGTKDKPLKSFEAAFSKAASVDRDGGIIIYIRGGVYDVGNGLEIPENISGSENNPVIISAYPGEDVKLTGGINISGKNFKVADDELAQRKLPEGAKGKVYSVDLKALGYAEYPQITQKSAPTLKVGNTEYTIARWPNTSTVKMGKYTGEDGKDGVIDIGPVTNDLTGNTVTGDTGEGFEFQIIDNRPFSWENTDDLWMFGSFAAEYLTAYQHIRSFNEEKQSIRTYTHESYGAKYNAHNAYYYLNVLEELDIPGEWYLDRKTGMLYIYPVSDISSSDVSIAMSANDLVTFAKGAEYVVLNGVTVCDTNGRGIVINGYRNIVQNCTLSGVGGAAVNFVKAKNCGVINSKAYGSISISDNLNSDKNIANDAANLRPTRNFIQNNYVIGSMINVRYGVQNIISHNTVMNCASMCVYIANTQESIVEYNDVVGGPWRTIDGGMLYSEGGTDNIYNHIRYNYFHHSTVTIRQWPFGIYFDDLTCNSFAYGNRVQQGSIFMHGGSRNVAYNNVIIDETASPSVYNSDNYAKGGMRNAFVTGWLASNGSRVSYNTNGRYKVGQVTWKNRYPTVYEWFRDLQIVRKQALDPNYKQTEYERSWLAPQENVYVNNVLYNSRDVSGDVQYEKEAWREKNYKVPEGTEIFEDYENRIYNIKPDSEVYKVIKDFEPLPPQEKMGVIDLQDKISMDTIYPIYPINDTNVRCFPNDIAFKWTKSPTATYYNLEIATDKEFNNIIGSYMTKENSYIFTGELDIDTVYYWRVTALCYAVAADNPVKVMDTAVFRTYTYEEAAANTTLDLAVYEEQCRYIRSIAETIIEESGTDVGVAVYKQGTKQKLSDMVEISEKRIEAYALQREVDNELTQLKREFIELISENAVPYTRKYTPQSAEKWKISSENGKVTQNEDGFSVKSLTGSSVIAHDTRILAPGETVSARINFGKNGGWDAFGIKQIDTEGKNIVTSAKGYYIIVKQDMIELQRYPATGGAVIAEAVNKEIIRPDTYHDIEVSCTPEDGNAHIVFKVDGVVIIDYLDSVAPINDLGYFSIQSFNEIKVKTD